MSKETDAEDLEDDKQWIREAVESLQNLGLDDWAPIPETVVLPCGTLCHVLGTGSFENSGELRQKCSTCGHYWTVSTAATHGLCENCASSILELILPLLAKYKTALELIWESRRTFQPPNYSWVIAQEALKDG